MWRRYLLWFAHEHVDFRQPEMDSILSMFKIPIKFIENPCIEQPYWVVELPSEEYAKKLASRSVLLKNCIELWARGRNEEQLHTNLRNTLQNSTRSWVVQETNKNIDVRDNVMTNDTSSDIGDTHFCANSLIEACSSKDQSFKIEVETFCKHFSINEKVEKIEKFSYLPLEGPVKLKNPDITLSYIEFYGVDPNNVPEKPHQVFFGKWIADGQRDLIQYHSLKKRQFIGNTSMDAQLALIMANQAQVAAGDLVLDPFVGSGSLLVAAAHFGGYVWGSDIDFMMLHGRTRPTRVGEKVRSKQESIRGNMYQYGTQSQYLDVVVSDSSRALWKPALTFDSIVTDPPYGVREPLEKVGIEKENYTLSDEHLANHIPCKVDYSLSNMYGDLLQLAAAHLLPGRRVVCWYPVLREEYEVSQLPSHPCLNLLSNSEQVLSKLTSRRLLTYERNEVPCVTSDAHAKEHNKFREKYFATGEMSRRERKQLRRKDRGASPTSNDT